MEEEESVCYSVYYSVCTIDSLHCSLSIAESVGSSASVHSLIRLFKIISSKIESSVTSSLKDKETD